MAELKTKRTRSSVKKFIDGIEHDRRREDARELAKMMEEITGEKPAMWGDAIVGFGEYHYKYDSGREGDWFITGFSPRKSNISLYIMAGFENYQDLLSQLGKHKTGASCLYVNKLDDIDRDVLRTLIKQSVTHMKKREKTKNA